jgi:hypothetical protein
MHRSTHISLYLAAAAIVGGTIAVGNSDTPAAAPSTPSNSTAVQPAPGPANPVPAPAAAETTPAAVTPPSQQVAECPAFAAALEGSLHQRTLVLVSAESCQPCRRLKKALEDAGIIFALVDREQHPRTYNQFHPGNIPFWCVYRNREVVANGWGVYPYSVALIKKTLEETP